MVRGARVHTQPKAYLLMGEQHALRAGIVRDDRELFHKIIGVGIDCNWPNLEERNFARWMCLRPILFEQCNALLSVKLKIKK